MTDTVELSHDVLGDPDGPVLLLVHGLGATRDWWPPALVERFTADHRVVLPDLRDSGRSPSMDHLGDASDAIAAWSEGREPDVPYGLDAMAADLVGLLDELEVDRAHVVGVSMGGMVAQHVAFGHHSRTASLTSIMSTTGAPDIPAGDPTVLASLQESAPTHSEEAFVAHGVAGARASANSPLFDEADAERRYRAYWRHGKNPAGSARQLVAVVADGDRTQRLAQVVAPTLVAHGERDPMVRVEGGRATAAAIAGAQYLELDRVGHELPRAVHDEVATAIRRLVAGADEGAGAGADEGAGADAASDAASDAR